MVNGQTLVYILQIVLADPPAAMNSIW